ncbi:MAG: hypothetical protein RI955_999 [Bacteroidota bacterium]|jgi:4-amino-4-deoxy-L-arabinose transferase-like glycosyltransferase
MIKKIFFSSEKRTILFLLVLGFILRLIYLFFFSPIFARAYLGMETIFFNGGDFGGSLISFKNLIYHGAYTINLNNEMGYYSRMPGYSFFVGIITLLTGEPQNLYIISIIQILLDVYSIYLIYKIGKNIWNETTGIILGFLYATHPIIILWCPVLMSDSLGALCSLLTLYFYSKSESKYKWFWVGLSIGFGTLIRPQTILTIPIIGLIELIYQRKKIVYFLKCMSIMGITILFTYGLYPMRNYFFHHKIILFQDLRGSGGVWNDATVNYMHYIYSVQSKWDPAWTNIMRNEKFTVDKAAFAISGDSAILMAAIYKAQNCSYAFSCWSGYWQGHRLSPKDTACDVEIANTFALLREHQIKQNAYHYWVTLPLENLTKCFFKSQLSTSRTQSPMLKLVPIIFFYRSILLLIGLFACIWILLKMKLDKKTFLFILINFLGWYFLICFGTMPQLRNIEMRYLLPVDVLLLIPAAIIIQTIFIKLKPKH